MWGPFSLPVRPSVRPFPVSANRELLEFCLILRIYLLQSGFHPVAVGGRIVQK
jgi:hypothetical protein